MKTTIDAAGRLVVPKRIREAAHLQPGTQVRFRLLDGRVEIEPVPLSVTLDQTGALVVAFPREDGAALTKSDVDETIAEIRSGVDSDRLGE